MAHEVVLDIETQNTFEEVGGHFTDKLKVSVVCAYFYETDTWESFLEADLPKLTKKLESASRIIGYNTIGFDMPVLNNYYAGDLLNIPQLDMLAHIYKSLGYRIKLDSVASATVGQSKTAHGLQAVAWWKEGKIQEIIDYCMSDVEVTKKVYEFGKQNGYVLFDDRLGERRACKINFCEKPNEKAALNLSLGF